MKTGEVQRKSIQRWVPISIVGVGGILIVLLLGAEFHEMILVPKLVNTFTYEYQYPQSAEVGSYSGASKILQINHPELVEQVCWTVSLGGGSRYDECALLVDIRKWDTEEDAKAIALSHGVIWDNNIIHIQ